VHGNIDDGNDRSWPGSFASTAVNGRDRARFLWQHNGMEPPVAAIKDVREVGRPELPQSVLGFAPNANGGVEVTREYLDTPRGNEILAGIKAGAIEEMSYAYDVTRSDFEEIDGKQIRNIREVKIYDFSDVNWGMNPATVAAKGGPHAGLPFQVHSATVLAAVEEFQERAKGLHDLRAKEGRTLSTANVARLQSLYDALLASATDLKALLDATAPKSDPAAIRLALLQFERERATLLGVKL
jgi:HK97 family phage prohead protease